MNSALDKDVGSRGSILPRRFSLLSYNIQVGVDTGRYREYVTKGWKHVFPHRERMVNLNRMASMLSRYDMVSLQEVDAGSLRCGFVDITEYLAHRAGFPYWYRQVNRNIGVIAQHSNGFLTRFRPSKVTHHKLPGGPGRGAMLFEFGSHREALLLCSAHLALGRRARAKQLAFLSELLRDRPNIVLMGDLNAGCDATEIRRFIEAHDMNEPACDQATFPSWRPVKKFDHILVSRNLNIIQSRVLDYPLSDHLPVAMELELPEEAITPPASAQLSAQA
ncbi:endonuclease/exonuclease/phosphatase family protein [Thiolapillus sp.]